MMRSCIYILIIIVAVTTMACTGLKNITDADPLYLGYKITFTDAHPPKKTLDPVIKSALKPEPNNKFLWMRPSLARYNMLSDSARTKKFWKNRIQAPVLMSHTQPQQVSSTLKDRLFHQGYFQNKVRFDKLYIRQRKVRFQYVVSLDQPYTLGDVSLPEPDNDLTQKINDAKTETKLTSGNIYTLDAIKNERIRIDLSLKEKGYIYFSPDFILMRADTVTGDHQVNVVVTVKPETPPESRIPYSIRNIYIHDDYVLGEMATDTSQHDQYFLISRNKTVDFNTLQQGIFLKPGERYARSNYMYTIRALSDLPIIRNVNVKFLRFDDTNQLDVFLFLSQRKRFAYTADFNTVFRSTNYFGPGVIFSYTDRNANRGAEMLKLNLRGSFEMQIVDGKINPAYEFGVSINYTLPKFFPGLLLPSSLKSLPKTTITAGYNLFNRLDLYKLNALSANLKYSWSKTDRLLHSFYPIEITFTRLPEDSKSNEFIEYLEDNPGVQRSFDEQFILGMGYEITYQSATDKKSDFFLRAGLDVAGNLLNAIFSSSNATPDTLGRYSLFGVPYSQYIRPRLDLHYGFKINPHSKVVSRFSAGVGIPLGNSTILPYIKQFYVGGTNSLRSFIARSLGPGSEVPPEGYNDVTGDIRLEGNLEYRFDMAGSLKGALFIDAGNIWLYNDDPARPNGTFHFDTFIDQLAISSGWGLRWDFDFIVARLDFAYTLRNPSLPEGERWTSEINFWKPTVSFAIGYPF